MTEKITKGEMHGCIVCGKLYQLYVVSDLSGKYIDCKVMSAGAKHVQNSRRALVACEKHTEEQIESAVARVFGKNSDENDN